jgi:hypothetical protein
VVFGGNNKPVAKEINKRAIFPWILLIIVFSGLAFAISHVYKEAEISGIGGIVIFLIFLIPFASGVGCFFSIKGIRDQLRLFKKSEKKNN